MGQIEVTKAEIMTVYPKVAKRWPTRWAATSIGRNMSPATSTRQPIDQHGLRWALGSKIPRGKIVENARGDLPEAEFEQKGIVTEKGIAQLKAYLSELPAERFKTPMKVADIPRLFTPETFCKRVVRAHKEAPASR
jgi:hypothetical protein